MGKTIKIVIEDKKKGKVEIPLTQRQARDIYDLPFMLMGGKGRMNEISSLLNKKFAKVMDALDEGGCYEMKGDKMVHSKYKFYHSGRKSIWR